LAAKKLAFFSALAVSCPLEPTVARSTRAV
jgi:hypothetical protein